MPVKKAKKEKSNQSTTTSKVKLNRFYLSEKYDNDRNISFNLKRANVSKLLTFKTFVEGVEEFNKIASTLEGNSRVWFHQKGAFRGSTTPEKTGTIIERVEEANVKDENAIEFINQEKLVDIAEPKTKKVEVEEVEEFVLDDTKEEEVQVAQENNEEIVEEVVEEVSKTDEMQESEHISEQNVEATVEHVVDDFERVAQDLIIYVTDANLKRPRETELSDIHGETEYEFIPTMVKWNENSVLVYYVIRDGERESKEYSKVVAGFKGEELKNREITKHYVDRSEWSTVAYWLIGTEIVLAVACLVLLALFLLGIFQIVI
ncbi:hypothetical protein E1I18_02320 [Mycoplasmopsis mucosicanis]|uniref:Uncharacterized protein n=1 Tax=Mycoplasmopsis mucosicanis TaxID=458208 RepID=A0A507SKM4_9BACT|nr:hypothetical protein [Mycoplasmopsis mucosicanis]TQC51496.1 hypothetical protein E1I18_02320 [Mycoplasmopsis mucosicanis]